MAVRKIQASFTMPWEQLVHGKVDFDMRISYITKSLCNALLREAGYPVDYTVSYTQKNGTLQDEKGKIRNMFIITAELRYVK